MRKALLILALAIYYRPGRRCGELRCNMAWISTKFKSSFEFLRVAERLLTSMEGCNALRIVDSHPVDKRAARIGSSPEIYFGKRAAHSIMLVLRIQQSMTYLLFPLSLMTRVCKVVNKLFLSDWLFMYYSYSRITTPNLQLINFA